MEECESGKKGEEVREWGGRGIERVGREMGGGERVGRELMKLKIGEREKKWGERERKERETWENESGREKSE